MPTVGIYVKMRAARLIASRWGIQPDTEDMNELIRQITEAALDEAAGIEHPSARFRDDCPWQQLHKTGNRCRHCGGDV